MKAGKRPSDKINLGLLGASQIAARIVPSIRSVPEIQLHSVAAGRPGAAKLFAETHSIPMHRDDYDQVLSDSRVDAVYISTLNVNHAELIKKSLLAGKHVLCEKPITLTATDAEACFSLAHEMGLILLEGLMYRLHPQIKALKEIIASGRIGQIHSVRANFSFALYDLSQDLRPKRAYSASGGGALSDVGCYCLDFIHSLVVESNELPSVRAASRCDPADPSFDLSTTALLRYSENITAVLECAVDGPSLNNWEVSGEKGSVSALRFDPQGSNDVPLYYVNDESQAELVQCRAVDAFSLEFKNFAQAAMGRAKLHLQPQDSIRNAKLSDLIRAQASKP